MTVLVLSLALIFCIAVTVATVTLYGKMRWRVREVERDVSELVSWARSWTGPASPLDNRADYRR